MFSDECIKLETYKVCKNKMNKYILKKYKSLRGPIHFEIFLSLFGPTTKNVYIKLK